MHRQWVLYTNLSNRERELMSSGLLEDRYRCIVPARPVHVDAVGTVDADGNIAPSRPVHVDAVVDTIDDPCSDEAMLEILRVATIV